MLRRDQTENCDDRIETFHVRVSSECVETCRQRAEGELEAIVTNCRSAARHSAAESRERRERAEQEQQIDVGPPAAPPDFAVAAPAPAAGMRAR